MRALVRAVALGLLCECGGCVEGEEKSFCFRFFFLLICVIQKTNITFNRAKVRQKENTMFVIGSIYCERV